jgi:SecD/SecF fusion protein
MVKNLSRKLLGLAFFSALALWAILQYSLHLGLDLSGGARISYGFDFDGARAEGSISEAELRNKEALLQGMADIFTRRLAAQNIPDIPIYPSGASSLVIEIPNRSEEEVARIKEIIQNQGLLAFRIIADVSDGYPLDVERQKWQDWRAANPEGTPAEFNRVPEADGGPRAEINWYPTSADGSAREALAGQATDGALPVLMMDAIHPEWSESTRSYVFVGGDLSYVGPTLDNKGMPAVAFEFSAGRKTAFTDFTTEYKDRGMAIILNNEVFSAPNINDTLPGQGIIQGGLQGFTQEEVKELTTVLRTGSLKVLPQLESESYVGPGLGQDAINTGLRSALAGAGIVLLFMLIYYRMNGFVALLTLGFNGFLLLGAIHLSQATLTLPGLAGLVLTIGMAVDANILIFERVREEWGKGRELKQAYKNGYDRAFWTIIDANVTTLIAGAILFQVGTGPVQGFASMLCLGILTTLFSSLVFSRVVMHTIIFGKKAPEKVSMMAALAGKATFDFLKLRKIAAVFSVLMVTFGILMYSAEGKHMMGIDFAGGSTARVHLAESTSIADLRGMLPDFQVTIVEDEMGSSEISTDFQITKKLTPEQRAEGVNTDTVEAGKDLAQEMVNALATTLNDKLIKKADGSIDMTASFPEKSTVGARVSGEIQGAAVRAILLSLILIVVYMTFRFREYRYGLAAVVALFHDVIITLGVLALAHRTGLVHVEIDLEIIAAFLTIIGYSLNDTIVVFDRIRENLPRRKEGFREIINISINQSLSRTILTSLTTFFVVAVLFVANRPFHNTLEGFSFAMLIGIIIGTYSSMFVASPLLVFFDRWARKHQIEEYKGDPKKAIPAKS